MPRHEHPGEMFADRLDTSATDDLGPLRFEVSIDLPEFTCLRRSPGGGLSSPVVALSTDAVRTEILSASAP
ncbi:MAG: hypothetical protein SFV15_11465 [Polyangiaceae bacterium]|nr:hypothetical protein [Polyangiaceae bacterium]